MYEFLQSTHSILRYVLLAFLLWTMLRSLTAWILGGHYYASDERSALFTVIFAHIQLLIGLALYFFMSEKVRFTGMGEVMKDEALRFFTVEHITGMLLAIILITIGRSRSKRAYSEISKHRAIAVYFLIASLLIFFSIPWPFLRDIGSGWL